MTYEDQSGIRKKIVEWFKPVYGDPRVCEDLAGRLLLYLEAQGYRIIKPYSADDGSDEEGSSKLVPAGGTMCVSCSKPIFGEMLVITNAQGKFNYHAECKPEPRSKKDEEVRNNRFSGLDLADLR
jgi:hypothetical protein